MTNRLKAFVVTLEDNLREDDAEPLRQAISMLKGVVDVSVMVENVDDHVARMKVRHDFLKKVLVLFNEEFPSGKKT